MPGLPGVDFSQWPAWLITFLIIVNIFKQQIGAAIPDAIKEWSLNPFKLRAERQADREEFQQEMEQVRLNSRLQTEATDQLRKSWREEQWVEMLQQMLDWQREDLTKYLNEIKAGQSRQLEILNAIHGEGKRTANILTTINISLSTYLERLGKSRDQS